MRRLIKPYLRGMTLRAPTLLQRKIPNIRNGLTLEYDFSEVQGSTVYDQSGNGNHGTISGALLVSDEKLLGSLEWDGADDYVQITSDASIDFDVAGGKYTVEAIINPDSDGENNLGRIFNKAAGGGSTLFNVDSESGGNVGLVAEIEHDTTDAVANTSGRPVVIGQKNHVFMVYNEDGDKKIKIYCNSSAPQALATDTAGDGDVSDDTGNDMFIGAQSTGTIFTFDGKIHLFKLYPGEALTAQDIQDRLEGKAISKSPASSYDFSAGSGSTLKDKAGSNDGTISGATWGLRSKTGIMKSRAMYFDETPNDYVERGTQLFSDYPFTLAALGRIRKTSVNQYYVSLNDESSSSVYYGIRINSSGEPEVIVRNGGSEIAATGSGEDCGDEAWHLVCGVFVSDTSRFLYKDGIQLVEGTDNLTYNSGVDIVAIGRARDDSPQRNIDGGRLSWIGAWNRALSANEIRELWEYLKHEFGITT